MGEQTLKWKCGLEGVGRQRMLLFTKLREKMLAKLMTSEFNLLKNKLYQEMVKLEHLSIEEKRKKIEQTVIDLVTGTETSG